VLRLLRAHVHVGPCREQEDDRAGHEHGQRSGHEPVRYLRTSLPPGFPISTNTPPASTRSPAAASASSTAARRNSARQPRAGARRTAASAAAASATPSRPPCVPAATGAGTGSRPPTTPPSPSPRSPVPRPSRSRPAASAPTTPLRPSRLPVVPLPWGRAVRAPPRLLRLLVSAPWLGMASAAGPTTRGRRPVWRGRLARFSIRTTPSVCDEG
jgi:hypothetical protein